MNKTESLTELLALHTDAGDVYQHPDVRNFYYTEGAESFFRHAGESALWLRDTLAWHPDVLTGVLTADEVCSVVLLITPARRPSPLTTGTAQGACATWPNRSATGASAAIGSRPFKKACCRPSGPW